MEFSSTDFINLQESVADHDVAQSGQKWFRCKLRRVLFITLFFFLLLSSMLWMLPAQYRPENRARFRSHAMPMTLAASSTVSTSWHVNSSVVVVVLCAMMYILWKSRCLLCCSLTQCTEYKQTNLQHTPQTDPDYDDLQHAPQADPDYDNLQHTPQADPDDNDSQESSVGSWSFTEPEASPPTGPSEASPPPPSLTESEPSFTESKPRILCVGEIGVGKTTLMEDLLDKKLNPDNPENRVRGVTKEVQGYEMQDGQKSYMLVDVPGAGDKDRPLTWVLDELHSKFPDDSYAGLLIVLNAMLLRSTMGAEFLLSVMGIAFGQSQDWHKKTIIVLTHWDKLDNEMKKNAEQELGNIEQEVREACKMVDSIPKENIVCKGKKDVKDVKLAISRVAANHYKRMICQKVTDQDMFNVYGQTIMKGVDPDKCKDEFRNKLQLPRLRLHLDDMVNSDNLQGLQTLMKDESFEYLDEQERKAYLWHEWKFKMRSRCINIVITIVFLISIWFLGLTPEAPKIHCNTGMFLVGSKCQAVKCTIEGSNFAGGTACRCRDAYNGSIQWHGSTPLGACYPALCDIENSNRLPGNDCSCLPGFKGAIRWSGELPQGLCTPVCPEKGAQTVVQDNGTVQCLPSPCDIENSNNQPGLGCSCNDGFYGSIEWDGPYHSGRCAPATCHIENSNRLPGKKCACLEGFVGTIDWIGKSPQGECHRACPEDGVQAVIDSDGTVQCIPAPCSINGSNGQPGSGCTCSDGYSGNITWKGPHASGKCVAAECNIQGSDKVPGPACACQPHFHGSISWSGPVPSGNCSNCPKDGYYTTVDFAGQRICKAMECNMDHSNMKPGKACSCLDGYTGKIEWTGLDVSGGCSLAPCKIEHSNGLQGLACACGDGYAGNIQWSQDRASGMCLPAPCKVLGSNHLAGLACACRAGFEGIVTWKGPVASGPCTKVQCDIPNARESGESCECSDGYEGNITFDFTDSKYVGECTPAPCNISNSNNMFGPKCACNDGYTSSIQWIRGQAQGMCTPVACHVENSNNQPGPSCACRNGYKSTITWSGAALSGNCTAAPCHIRHSNKAPGLKCRCLPHRAGKISWSGDRPFGECIVQATTPHAIIVYS